MRAQEARCLRCGYEYSLTHGHRTVTQSRLCPSCCYAGWEPLGRPSGQGGTRFGRGGLAGHRFGRVAL